MFYIGMDWFLGHKTSSHWNASFWIITKRKAITSICLSGCEKPTAGICSLGSDKEVVGWREGRVKEKRKGNKIKCLGPRSPHAHLINSEQNQSNFGHDTENFSSSRGKKTTEKDWGDNLGSINYFTRPRVICEPFIKKLIKWWICLIFLSKRHFPCKHVSRGKVQTCQGIYGRNNM